MRAVLFALLITVALPAAAQVNSEKYRSLFLVGEFGEVCTMCEVIVICAEGGGALSDTEVPADGTFTLYHLQTRTFWSQISTIWEWFVANFSSESLAQGHTRPVRIYRVAAGSWSGPEVVEARIALEPPVLSFGDRSIDRVNRAWSTAGEPTPSGYCQRLPLWDSLEVIAERNAGGAEQ